jgi:multiple sugar transport system permease protein
MLLNQGLPGQGILRSLVLLPFVLPGVVAAILWRFMYDPQLGLINSILLSLNLIETARPGLPPRTLRWRQ